MTRRTPAQKLARTIQAQTGDPYTVCLAAAKKILEQQKTPSAGR